MRPAEKSAFVWIWPVWDAASTHADASVEDFEKGLEGLVWGMHVILMAKVLG